MFPSQSKHCFIRYVEFALDSLPAIKSILEGLFSFPHRQTLSYRESYLTKENIGIYSHGIRHRHLLSQHKHQLEIIQKYEGYLTYQYKSSFCQSDPTHLLKQIGYKEQTKYDIEEEIWRNDRFELEIHFHVKLHILQIRQFSQKAFTPQLAYITEMILAKLGEHVKMMEPIHEQFFRPDKIDVVTKKG